MNIPIIIVGAIVGAIVGGVIGKEIRLHRMAKSDRKLTKEIEDNLKDIQSALTPLQKNTALPNTDINSINRWVSQVHNKHHG